jgi:5-(carboxyamino)imidazole ribonucleotide synthase
MPLGQTTRLAYCAMINFIGRLPAMHELLTRSDSHYHDYGKQPNPRRKLGHLTLRANRPETAEALAQRVASRISSSTGEVHGL